MLKHKLMRSSPATMAELMAIADKYALADSAMQTPIRLDSASKMIAPEPAGKRPADSGAAGARCFGRRGTTPFAAEPGGHGGHVRSGE